MRRTLHRLVIVAATLSLVGCATEATLGPLHAAQHDCQMGNLAACMALPQLQANVDAETQANGNVVAAGLLGLAAGAAIGASASSGGGNSYYHTTTYHRHH